MKKLKKLFQFQSDKVVEDYDRGREISLEQVSLDLLTITFIEEPPSFEEAINFEQVKRVK
jgi:hypothetical protein